MKHVTEIGHDTFSKISSSTKCQGFCGLDEMKYQQLCISLEIGTFLEEADLYKNEKKNQTTKFLIRAVLNLQI